jgi:hypothetical protein
MRGSVASQRFASISPGVHSVIALPSMHALALASDKYPGMPHFPYYYEAF